MEMKPCARCPKGIGVILCYGCQQSFCMKHIVEHRQELAAQMDQLGQERDSLQDLIDQKENEHPLFVQINRWEEESMKRIQTTADIARANLRELLDQSKINVKSLLDKTTTELQTSRQSDAYTEIDLHRWSTELKKLRTLSQSPTTIQIVEDQEAHQIIHLIKILSKTSSILLEKSSPQFYGSTQERFAASTRSINLSDDGLLATHTTYVNSYETIFGKNTYSSGVHHLHFRVENKDNDNFFFGIVTSSEIIDEYIYSKPTANGWWGFDIHVVNGRSQAERHGKGILRKGDQIKLTFDCEKKEIRLENVRAEMTLQTSIDIGKCPFPWKLAITLSRPNDALRLLR